jgi:hypothetical protein
MKSIKSRGLVKFVIMLKEKVFRLFLVIVFHDCFDE